MHEYAIAQELVAQVNDAARRNGAAVVRRVDIQVGRLRMVVPEILQWGFSVAAGDSIAAGAELVIEEVPLLIRCDACGAESPLDDPLFVCPACGSVDVRLVAGDELILKSLEIGDEGDSDRSEHPEGQ